MIENHRDGKAFGLQKCGEHISTGSYGSCLYRDWFSVIRDHVVQLFDDNLGFSVALPMMATMVLGFFNFRPGVGPDKAFCTVHERFFNSYEIATVGFCPALSIYCKNASAKSPEAFLSYVDQLSSVGKSFR